MRADSLGFLIDSQIAGQRIIDFPDNRLLIDLCGEYDRNLADLEKKLSVQIIRRGNQLAVHGSSDAVLEAAAILNELYQRLEGGRDINRLISKGQSEFWTKTEMVRQAPRTSLRCLVAEISK